MEIGILSRMAERARQAILRTHNATYHTGRQPNADVYVERIERAPDRPWILEVTGVVQVEETGYEWHTQFDIETGIYTHIQYYLAGHICFIKAGD